MKKTAVELIEKKVKSEINIIEMDYNKGIQISVSVLVDVLKKILAEVKQAKEMADSQRILDTNHGYSQGYDDGVKNLEPMKPELLVLRDTIE